jgi:hypothetical protein
VLQSLLQVSLPVNVNDFKVYGPFALIAFVCICGLVFCFWYYERKTDKLQQKLDDREKWHQERYDILAERHRVASENFISHGLQSGTAIERLATAIDNSKQRRRRETHGG